MAFAVPNILMRRHKRVDTAPVINYVAGPMPPPGPPSGADALLLADGTDFLLLVDGTDHLLIIS